MALEPIAIVGRGCVLPGARDPDEFWANIVAGKSSLAPEAGGGIVRGFDPVFDPAGFAIDASEITRLDPLYLWVLHAARQALRESGQGVDLGRAGLVLGNLSYPSAGMVAFAEQAWRTAAQPGQGPARRDGRDRFCSGLPAHFAASALGLGAGGFALDAACASALYAIKLGCDRLRDKTADLMLAGGVSCPDRPLVQGGFRGLGAASPSGRSRPFHRGADGLVASEGAAVVALMRLADAVTAGAEILGVIRAVGLSNDGRAGGLLAPSQDGQERAMRLAYAAAGVPPETVSLVECHATGTRVGDAVEARSMARVFAGCADLPIGSVKSNVGHLLTAAGGAGLLKVLGALRAGLRPPSLHADDPIAELDRTPLRLLAEAEDWPGPRRAAVSAFGFGGTNAHLVVDEWLPGTDVPGPGAPGPGAPGPGAPAGGERPDADVPVAITAIGARVGPGRDRADFQRAVLLGTRQAGPRESIDVTLDGLRFPPRDLEMAHAQQVLLLEAAREAARDAALPRERTTVIIGMGADPEVARYPVLHASEPRATAQFPGPAVLGTMPNLVANRVNVQLDLAGPGYTVSAEEASGLVALELGARALRQGEADAAVVGAVDLSCEPVHQAALRSLGRECVPGDAAVVLVLERLPDARRAGRTVIAVLDEPARAGAAAGTAAEVVVGDQPAGPSADGAAARFDPADLFGRAHAAHGLVAVAAAATAVLHQAIPRSGELAVPVSGSMSAAVVVDPLGAGPAHARLRPGGPAQAWTAGPAQRLRVYSGANRAAVLEALAAGRESATGPARLAMIAGGQQDQAERAEAAARWLAQHGPRPDAVAYRDAPLGGQVAFVFTNGSAAYPGMGAELALAFPDLAAEFEASHAPLRQPAGPRPAGAGGGVIDRILAAAVLGAFHAQLTRRLLRIRPDAAIGYSSGESAALAALGAWTDPAALYRDVRDSELLATDLTGELRAVRRAWRRLGVTGERWACYLVGAPASKVRQALADQPAAYLMAINTPDACVIGGEAAACEAVLRRLDGAAVAPVDYAIAAHAPVLADVAAGYRQLHRRPTATGGVRFYSGASGESYLASADRAADALLAHVLGTIDFVAVIERAWADGVRVFIEHGPQAQCTGWIRRILGDREHVSIALDAPAGQATRQLCRVATELAAAGVAADTAALFDRLAAAAPPVRPTAETIRLAAHPPPLRLPAVPVSSGPAVATAGVLPRAPRLMPVADSYIAAPDRNGTGHPLAPLPATDAGQQRVRPAAPQPTGLPGLAARQFENVTALHHDYLARMSQAQAEFLRARRQVIAALATIAPEHGGTSITAAPAGGDLVAPAEPQAPAAPRGPSFDRAQLEYLADGKVSALFGPRFAVLDDRVKQTRLPKPPMLLADRVTGIDAVQGSMGTGTIWTETDIAPDAWYLDPAGRVPAGLMIEAGQADLLLISWLGIDLIGQGDRVYRLLGCEVTFHGGPALAGQALKYQIRIYQHAEHDGVRIFFFRYDCYVGDELIITVRDGQAGFFTAAELASADGVPWDPARLAAAGGPPDRPAVPVVGRRFGPQEVRALAEGRPADCFGHQWAATSAHVRTPRIGSGRMLRFDTVTDLDPGGGPLGRGYLRAEATVRPDDWFFEGHFKNDPCMPGTLMLDGGMQAMEFYLAALGFTLDRDGWRFEPVPAEPCRVRCRREVSPASRLISYEIFVSGLSAGPCPTLYADILGTVDGVRAFHARRAAIRLVPDWPLDHWRQLGPPRAQPTGQLLPLPALGGLAGLGATGQAGTAADGTAANGTAARAAADVDGIRQDYAALLACAWGRPTQAFGPAYARFDGPRVLPRLPGPPYHFVTRIVAVDGPPAGLRPGTTATAEYDVPAQAWYFEQNGLPTMPFAVLMEVVLQPCGWLATYAGSVLKSEADVRFRNLDGTGTVLREVPPGTRVLRTSLELRSLSQLGDVTIVSFTASCTALGGPADGHAVFELETVFGFFPQEALASQVGLPPSEAERAIMSRPAEPAADLRARPPEPFTGSARLPGPMLLMLDRVTGYWPDAGQARLGRVRACKDIDPGEWFFRAHFFQDPVMPGSLGIEAMCQLLQWYLIERGAAAGLASARFEPIMTGQPLAWKYRGQVRPADGQLTVELEITAAGADDHGRYAIADGWLWVDGLRIYHVTGLGMRVIPGDQP
jgi:acyl transferase domain-containing protein